MSGIGRPARWRRPAVLALAGLLLLNLAALLAYTLPRSLGERSLDARLNTLRAEVEHRRLAVQRADRRQQLLAANGQDQRRMVGKLIGTREETLVPILRELETNAREFDLALGSYGLSHAAVEDAPLTRVQISIPVEGTYPALVAFLRRLEHSPRFITIDKLELVDRSAAGQRRTSLNLTLSAYLRAEDTGGGGDAR